MRSPDEEEGDDLFSDCRSEAGEGPASVAGEPTTTKPTTTTTTPSIRERLNLGMHNNGQEEELLVVAVADPHKVRDNIVLVNPSSSFLQIVVVIVCAINDKQQGRRWNEQFHGLPGDNKDKPTLLPQRFLHSCSQVTSPPLTVNSLPRGIF